MTDSTNALSGGAFLLQESDPRSTFSPEDFSAEDRLIGQAADSFLRREVLPYTEQIEANDTALMLKLMQLAGAQGLLGADIPRIYGGLGLKVSTAALIAEKLNWQQSFALTHEAHTVIATLPLLYFGNHDQKSRYLPKLASGEWIGSFTLSEANSGSDALAAETHAVLSSDGKHYVLNGIKQWITNSAFANLFTVFAQVSGKFTAFLVERDYAGVSFGDEEKKLGMRGTSTRRVYLNNVHVPIENAMEVGKGQYAAFCALNMGRFKLEAGAVGGLKETLAVCTSYAGERHAFGKSLIEFGLVQEKLAEMAASIFALESMVYRLAGDLDRAFEGIVADAPDASARYHRAAEEYAVECNIVKVIGSEAYSRHTDEAIQIHGGYGYSESFPVARAWRDQRLLRIGEGANEIVRLAIVRTLLRRDEQGRLALFETAQRLIVSPTFISRPRSWLAPVFRAAQNTKRLALITLLTAHEQLGKDFFEQEEIVARIADIICAAYALESLWLRCEKCKLNRVPSADNVISPARVAAYNFSQQAAHAGTYILDSLRLASSAGLDRLIQRLHRITASPMHLRRELATKIIEAGGYPI
jgi:alkylation response protein AidB-like acyl-CoA dehydrogenase